MASRSPSGDDDKSVRELVPELFALVLRYARQETLDPLKSLVRYVGWGVAGAILIAVGVVLVAVGSLRVVQTEAGTHLHGDLTWVPYAGALLVVVVVGVMAATRIARAPR